MFNGKIHYKWPFSIAMLVHQRVVSYGNLARKMFQAVSKVGRNCLNCLSVIWGDTPWFTSDSVLVTMIASFGHTHLTLLVIIISHYYPIKSPLYLMCVPSNPHIPYKFTRKDSHDFLLYHGISPECVFPYYARKGTAHVFIPSASQVAWEFNGQLQPLIGAVNRTGRFP